MIVANNIHRVDKHGVVARVTLRVTDWRLSLLGCILRRHDGCDRIVLPRREWLDGHDQPHQAEIIVFDDRAALTEFEAEALAAVKRLLRDSRR